MKQRAMRHLALTACLALLACSAAQTTGSALPDLPDEPEARAGALQRLLDEPPDGLDVDAVRDELASAKAAAAAQHADAGLQHLDVQSLTEAQAELDWAERWSPTGTRTQQLKRRLAEARAERERRMTLVRTQLQALSGLSYRPSDRAAWLSLLDEDAALAAWARGSSEVAHVREEVRKPAVRWLLAEATAQARAGHMNEAQTLLTRAQGLAPLDRRVFQTPEQLAAAAEPPPPVVVAPLVPPPAAPIVPSRPVASEAAPTATAAPTAAPASTPATAPAATPAAKSERASRKTARRPPPSRPAPPPRSEAAEAPQTAQTPLTETTIVALRAQLRAAEQRKLTGAAWLYGHALATLQPSNPALKRKVSAWQTRLRSGVAYRLALAPIKVPPQAPAGLAEAIGKAVRAQMTQALGSAITWAARPVGATGTLSVQLPNFTIVRSSTPEARRKAYVDRSEVGANPAFEEAKGRAAMALTSLNGALDQLRAVQESQNEAMRTLQQSREQLAELEQTITAEDARWYASHASPCKDGKLDCPETRGRQQWAANLTFYRNEIARDEATLRESEPTQAKLQAVVDDRQKIYDAAQKTLAATPTKSRRDVMLPHDYTVTNHTLRSEATLVLSLTEGGRTVAERDARDETQAAAQSSERVEVNGQVLEEARSSTLPDDAALVAATVTRLVASALPAVLDALGHVGDRLAQQALQTQDNLARVHALVLAAEARQAMSADLRAQVLSDLRERTGWDADSDTFDPSQLRARTP